MKHRPKRASDQPKEPLSPQPFGERVRRALFGHTVREIAKAVGVSQSAIYNWISGTNEPNLTKLAAFATATGVSVQWLVTGRGQMREIGPAYHRVTDLNYALSAEAQVDADARRELIFAREHADESRPVEIQYLEGLVRRLTARLENLESKFASRGKRGRKKLSKPR